MVHLELLTEANDWKLECAAQLATSLKGSALETLGHLTKKERHLRALGGRAEETLRHLPPERGLSVRQDQGDEKEAMQKFAQNLLEGQHTRRTRM